MFPSFISISAEGACPNKLTDIEPLARSMWLHAHMYVYMHMSIKELILPMYNHKEEIAVIFKCLLNQSLAIFS